MAMEEGVVEMGLNVHWPEGRNCHEGRKEGAGGLTGS
jgi:hypothetical protein